MIGINEFAGLLLGFLLSGGYLLVWPIYRAFHRRKNQRRQALLKLFLLELVLYGVLTGYVVYGIFRIPDFHHSFLFVEVAYGLLALFSWGATYGVWADSDPEVEC